MRTVEPTDTYKALNDPSQLHIVERNEKEGEELYYQIKIDRLPNKIIKWSVTFGNDYNSRDTEGELMIGVVKEFTSRLEVLEQMNRDKE